MKAWQKLRGPKVKCRDRILAALKWQAKSPQQLADELFVTAITIRAHLCAMLKDGLVFRKFFHNPTTNRPDYVYFRARFPAYAVFSDTRKRQVVQDVLGSWDAL